MTSYTNTFTGAPIQVTPTSYRAFTIAVDTELSWPENNEDNANTTADTMEVTASAASLSLTMPPANEVSNGKACLVRNVGANTFTVKDNAGGTIQSIAAGNVFWIYVKDNSTAAGTWSAFQFGTGTSSANAADLDGNGLTAIGSLLNVAFPVTDFNSDFTLNSNYRATIANWTGGAGTFSFDASSTLGNNWFVIIKNSGSGSVTLDPNSTETIDGVSSISLDAGESCIVACTGAALLSFCKNDVVTISFTRLVKSVAGGSDVTLTSAEAGYDIQEYTGLLTANINVIVPTAVSRWWVYNNTSGAFTLTVKTAAGTGVAITQGTRQIIHCDGTNVVLSVDAGTGTVSNIATGTGLSGGPITTTGTISIANTAVTAGTYGGAIGVHSTTFNAQGQATAASFTARSVTGTANRISVTDGDGVAGAPTVDISATYVGQSSITTLGTITTGVWNGTPIGVTYGGLGQTTLPVVMWGFVPSSIAGTSTTATVTFSSGQITDSTNAYLITKLTSSSWAVSNGNAALGYQGGTTLPNSDTIHFFACYGGSGTTIFAHNGVTPTPPAGYNTYYERIATINTNGSGALIPYTATEVEGGGLNCVLTTIVSSTVATTSSASTVTLPGIPTDIKVRPKFRVTNGTSSAYTLISDLSATDAAPAVNGTAPGASTINVGDQIPNSIDILTNTSGQVRARSSGSTDTYFYVDGWVDFRR